jgi:hypothetical protein
MNEFIGCWQLVLSALRLSDGGNLIPPDPDERGTLIYTADGHMSAHMMRSGRTHFASPNLWQATPEECQAAFSTYLAYFGRYEISLPEKMVIHHVDGSLFPNWVGTKQRRSYQFDGDVLTLTAPTAMAGGREFTPIMQWKRSAS